MGGERGIEIQSLESETQRPDSRERGAETWGRVRDPEIEKQSGRRTESPSTSGNPRETLPPPLSYKVPAFLATSFLCQDSPPPAAEGGWG